MSYLINENTVQVQPHWSSNWSNRKKTKMAKMRVNQNKSINRGVNSFFTESYVIEWTCCVRQRVEIRIKWNEWMDCFSGGWKVRRQTKIAQGSIEQEHNFSGSWKSDNAKYLLRIHSITVILEISIKVIYYMYIIYYVMYVCVIMFSWVRVELAFDWSKKKKFNWMLWNNCDNQ